MTTPTNNDGDDEVSREIQTFLRKEGFTLRTGKQPTTLAKAFAKWHLSKTKSLREQNEGLVKEVEERRNSMAAIVRVLGRGLHGLSNEELVTEVAWGKEHSYQPR